MNLHPDFDTNQVVTVMISLVVVLFAIITLVRMRILSASRKNLTAKYQNKVWSSPLEARVKYPDVEVFKYRRYGLLFGIMSSLLLTLTLMNWTTVNKLNTEFDDVSYVEADIEITPPQTTEPPPPPPPPLPPSVIEVPDELVSEMEENVEFMDQSIEAESIIDAPPVEVEHKARPAIIPPPPPPKEDVEEIFKVVEEMPRFPGCEDLNGNTQEKRACADAALYNFIHANLEYPSSARENNIQGTVVVQFVVNRDGSIQDAKVLRDIGAGCGEEVVRVVGLMNDQKLRWIPGKQRGHAVRVIFILPVKFKLLTS